jgi:hypothetical protein
MPRRAHLERSRQIRRFREPYRFEALESRWLLACQVFLDQHGTLLVIGDDSANQIEIVAAEQGVSITCDGHDHGTFAGLDAMELRTGDGDDTATIDNRNGLLRGIAIKVLGQAGNDLVIPIALDTSFLAEFFPALPALGIDGGEGLDAIEIVGGQADELYDVGSSGSAFQLKIHQTNSQAVPVSLDATNVESTKVRAGDGADDVDVTFPLPTDFTILGEAGDDFLRVRYNMFERDGTTVRPVESFDFKEAADLGDGKDRVSMQGADEPESVEVMGVPDATVPDPHIRITDLATGLLPFDGLIVSAEAIDVDTAGGDDQFAMNDAQGSLGGIDFTVNTGDDDDMVNVEINTGLQPPSDNPGAAGGSDPAVNQDPLLAFRFLLKTGAGDDTAFFKSVGGLKYETEVVDYQAGGGNDKIDFRVQSPRDSASLTYDIGPGVGDNEVLVAFEHGDIRHPYVLGALWNDSESPNQGGNQTGGQLSLDILADAGGLAVDLGLIGTPGSDTVDVNIAGACQEQKLDISTGDADDAVAVRVANPASSQGGHDPEAPAEPRRRAPTSINTGNGDDKVKFEETGVIVGDGGQADWSFLGGLGNDEFDLRVANARAGAQATWNWTTDSGDGDDLLKVHLFEIELGAGSLTDWSFLTGEGSDNIDFVRCFVDIGPRSTYGWRLGSGGGDDTLAVMILDVNFGAGVKAAYGWDAGPGKNEVIADVSGLTIDEQAQLNWSWDGGEESDQFSLALADLAVEPGGSAVLAITTRGGNDSVAEVIQGRFDGELHADLGEGDDGFSFDAPQGLQAAAIPDGPCLIVEAGGGNDSVIFRFGGLVSANLEIDVSLGDGSNSFLLDSRGWNATPDPQNPLLQPSLHVAGGAECDAIIARLGQVSGNLQVALEGREGNDIVAADLLFAQLGLGMIDIALAGGAGNDLLSLLAPGQSNQERTRLVIDGGAGFDIGIGTPNVDAFNCEVVIGARRRR